tara:strand:- start:169 stop:348 length:180 start_codon:yes stop_codon:yes gene_type:complete
MKTITEIEEEIEFHENEYCKIKKLIEFKSMVGLGREMYYGVMGRHAAKRMMLLWVLDRE